MGWETFKNNIFRNLKCSYVNAELLNPYYSNQWNIAQHFYFGVPLQTRGGSSFNEKWGVTLKWQHISKGGSGHAPTEIFGFWVSKTAFPAFLDTFEQNIKVSNHIGNSVSHNIWKKYFGPIEIILTFSVSLELNEIAKLNMADIS